MVTATIAAGKQGDPLEPDTVFGPAPRESQYRTVLEYVESAWPRVPGPPPAAGAASLGGGLEDGYFVEPTVFADVTPDMRISREEIFGPVISILKYDAPASTRRLPLPTTPSSASAAWSSARIPTPRWPSPTAWTPAPWA